MDFAREHLKQLGWQEGEGLGREHHGISEALKPKLKFDNCGVGHDPAREFTHTWWSEAYNSAAAKVTVTEATDGVRLAPPDDGSKKKKKKKEKKVKTKQAYSNFVTGGTLTGAQVTGDGAADAEKEKEEEPPAAVALPSDEQLLAACGGRTAHKGARHGHRMDGKLARIIAQEAAILARLTGKPEQPAQLAEEPVEADKKTKKKKRKRETVEEPDAVAVEEAREVKDSVSDDVKSEKKKKRKKRKDDENTVNESETCENGVHESAPEKRKKKKRKNQDS